MFPKPTPPPYTLRPRPRSVQSSRLLGVGGCSPQAGLSPGSSPRNTPPQPSGDSAPREASASHVSSFPRPCCPHLLGRWPIMVDPQWVCDFFFFLLGQSQGGCVKEEPKLWSPSPSQGPSQLPGCWLQGREGATKPPHLKSQPVTSKLDILHAGVTERINRGPCRLCHLLRATVPIAFSLQPG